VDERSLHPVVDACPDENALASALEQGVSTSPSLEHHLSLCAECRELVSELSRAEVPADDRLSRFAIGALLGAGAFGRVYEAFDRELERTVALKLLKRPDDPAAGARLLDEARIMAGLRHPNIVTVHDVGSARVGVFIVMERVRGETLAQWVRRARPSTEAILGVARMVGRALAAAHRAGVAHRDVKPDNVLIGADGHPYLVDFGLALDRPLPSTENAVPARSGSAALGGGTLTLSGSVVGTPAYLAPEQIEPGAHDPLRSDQFALCATVLDALRGAPSPRLSLAELPARQRRLGEQVGTLPIDRRLRAALQRGLAPDPRDRFPSIDALLDAMRPPRGARAAQGLALSVAVIVAAAVGIWAVRDAEASAAERCTAEAGSIEAVWNGAARARLERAFVASGTLGASRLAERSAAGYDALAAAWQREVDRACAPGDASAGSLDCLRRVRLEVHASLEMLARGDPEIVPRAVLAHMVLTAPESCRDERWPSPSVSDVELRALATARAGRVLGRFADGLALAAEGERHAGEGTWLRAAFAMERCEDLLFLDRLEEARDACIHAAADADVARADTIRGRALAYLVYIVGYHQRRYDEAEELAGSARAVALRLGSPDELLGLLESHQGAVAYRRGDPSAASEAFSSAHTRFARTRGEGHPSTITARENVAIAAADLGRRVESAALLEGIAATQVDTLGEEHPNAARALHNLGATWIELGRYRDSGRVLERALSIRGGLLGETHRSTRSTERLLARVELELGRLDRAEAMLEALLARAAPGEERSTDVASVRMQLAEVSARRGHDADAIAQAGQALAIREERLGTDDVELVEPLTLLARVAHRAARRDPAVAWLERAIAITELGAPADPLAQLPLYCVRAAMALDGWTSAPPELAPASLEAEVAPELSAEARLARAMLREASGEPWQEDGAAALVSARASESSRAAALVERIERWTSAHAED
jgi:tetratricopeptide (TPR) repeat protein/predicted Ser/Thr protein kinase